MAKVFNVNGACKDGMHYMVDLKPRLAMIKAMIDAGQYFTINRARQYGKTTTLRALENYLKNDYLVVSLDFQKMSALSFESEQTFVAAFSEELLDNIKIFPGNIEERLTAFVEETARINSLQALFKVLRVWCEKSDSKLVMIIDEVDTATNNQVFLDFLAQMRAAYLNRDVAATFQSVILAGVYDVRNLRRKIRDDGEHGFNSPWNIAADFNVDMSFSKAEITGMLSEYEADYHTGMNTNEIAGLLYDYTSGYPFLVSRLCKLLDEYIAGSEEFPDKRAAWTKEGFLEALKLLLNEKNTLFGSLLNKLNDYPKLKEVLYTLLFQGKGIAYNPDDEIIEMALMFGFVKINGNAVVVANRVFETRLYNYFLTC